MSGGWERSTIGERRFLIFGLVCAAWLAVMHVSDAAVADAAGQAWFATWGVQMAVVAALRGRSLPTLPGDAHEKLAFALAALACPPGLRLFGRMARLLHPVPFDRRSPQSLETMLNSAESSHSLTFAIVTLLTLVAAATGMLLLPIFLTFWNVCFNLYPVLLQRYNRDRLRQLSTRRRVPCA